MAAVVATGSTPLNSSIATQETGSRNKRKFRADPPLADENALIDALHTELRDYNLFPAEKSVEVSNHENHAGICDMCRNHMFGPKEEAELVEFHDVDWSCLTESELEEILLSNLDMVFRTAMKLVTSHGYSEEVATNAVLSTGLCYGYKDTVSNVVDNALTFLRCGKEVDSSPRENVSEDLKRLEKSVLADMISVLREVRPLFSTGDAMWRLLMSDANISHACGMDSNSTNTATSTTDEYLNTTVPQLELESITDNDNSIAPIVNVLGPDKLTDCIASPENRPQSEVTKVVGIPNLPYGRFAASNENFLISKHKPLKETSISRSNHVEESSSVISLSPQEERVHGSRKVNVSNSKREFVLRQKSIHFEKNYRALGSKSVSRACKQSGLGSLMFDRRCKSLSDSTSKSMKNASLKIAEVPGIEKSLTDAKLSLSYSSTHSSSPTCNSKEVISQSFGPITNTELSLSPPTECSTGLNTTPDSNAESANCSSYNYSRSSLACRDRVPEDNKDDMLLILVSIMHGLRAQLQDWTDWAQQKVMQAARRLGKDKAELQSLRQEKEEVTRAQKERYAVEENTRKKLSEMELARSKASAQVERANAAAHRLEYENTKLRLEMEAAKLRASESAVNCQEASRREIMTMKMFQSWEKQQVLFQDELGTEKHLMCHLQQRHEQVKELRDQSETRWKQEEKVKNEALAQAANERNEREYIETSAKSQENALRLEAENDLRRCKGEIHRLEQQIAQLRLVTNSTNIAAPRWGSDKSYASRLTDGRKNLNDYILAKFIESQEYESDELQRERECVMCLSEEMSVVFLPCAHQVVCVTCNELHQKQGMKDCPSCRTLIQRRILIRSA